MNTQEMTVFINRAENRFELEVDEKLSFMTYVPKDDRTLVLIHTEIHPSLRNDDAGLHLIMGTLDYIKKNKLKLIPLCSLVAAFIKRHPEYHSLVSAEYRQPL
ncbi:hypothetical protein GCM10027347_20840 [Larkinella harenae]